MSIYEKQENKYRNELSPEWLREVCMIEKRKNALVISPHYLKEHNIKSIIITDNKFGSHEIIKVSVDFVAMKRFGKEYAYEPKK